MAHTLEGTAKSWLPLETPSLPRVSAAAVKEAEDEFRKLLDSSRRSAATVGRALSAWFTAASGSLLNLKTTPPTMRIPEQELLAGLGIIVGLRMEQGWETELLVSELKRQAKAAKFNL